MKNPYYPIETLVEDVIVETPTIKTFVLAPSRPIGSTVISAVAIRRCYPEA